MYLVPLIDASSHLQGKEEPQEFSFTVSLPSPIHSCLIARSHFSGTENPCKAQCNSLEDQVQAIFPWGAGNIQGCGTACVQPAVWAWMSGLRETDPYHKAVARIQWGTFVEKWSPESSLPKGIIVSTCSSKGAIGRDQPFLQSSPAPTSFLCPGLVSKRIVSLSCHHCLSAFSSHNPSLPENSVLWQRQ